MIHGPFISAAEARRQGLNRYFTGKPCKHGHVALRRTQDSTCMDCIREWKRAARAKEDKKVRHAVEATRRQVKSLSALTFDQFMPIDQKALRIHLIHQFTRDMNWNNYGVAWELDHIRPLSSFDLSDNYQLKLCMSWMNIQPLSPSENKEKGESWSVQQEKHWRDWLTQLGYEGDFYLQHEH